MVVSVNTWSASSSSSTSTSTRTRSSPTSRPPKIRETFGDRDPASITATEIAEWIAALAETRDPATLGQYLIAFRLLLDHVGVRAERCQRSEGEAPEAGTCGAAAAVEGTLRGDPGGPRGEVAFCS